MVEETLKNADESLIKFSKLKKMLPKQVNHNTLKNIIDYLDRSNKIAVSIRGITWIENDSPYLRKIIEKGHVH